MPSLDSGSGISRRLALIPLGVLAVGAPALLWLRMARRVLGMVRDEFTFPVPPSTVPEGDPRFRAVTWELPGVGTQRALYLPPVNGCVVVFAHGSPGNGQGLLPEALFLADAGYGALLLDLPGYGGSAGLRDWGTDYDRAVAAGLEFVTACTEVNADRLGLFGYSMSTAIASRVAAEDSRIAALALLTPFTDLESQLLAQYQGRWPGMGRIAVHAFRAHGIQVEALAPRNWLFRVPLSTSVLLIGGALDTVVPPEMIHALSTDRPAASCWIAPGVGHVGFAESLGKPYLERLRRFFDRALLQSTGPDSDESSK